MVRRHGLIGVLVLTVCSSVATAGAPPPPAYPAGPTRGGLNLILPYYPATPRAGGMGLATVAVGGVDSHNPAALGFAKGIDVVADYGRLSFDHGPDLDIGHSQVVIPTPKLGGYTKVMLFGIHTRHEDASRLPGAGSTYIHAKEFGIASGVQVPLPDKVPGRLAFGFAGFPYDPSEVRLRAGGVRTAQGRGQSQIGSIRLGLLYQPIEQVSVGGEFTHIKDYVRHKVLIDPSTMTYLRQNDNYYVNLWTVGVAIHPDDKTTIGIQHLFGRAQGEGVRVNYDIFSAGIERRIPINEEIGVALRTGINDGSPTFGLGVTLPHGLRVDYALLIHYGEQVKNDFGHGDLHIIGVGKEF